MPGKRGGHRSCPIALAVTDAEPETRIASQAHWAGETAPGRLALTFAFGKTFEAQTETNTIGIALCFSRVFYFPFSKTFEDKKPSAVETRRRT